MNQSAIIDDLLKRMGPLLKGIHDAISAKYTADYDTEVNRYVFFRSDTEINPGYSLVATIHTEGPLGEAGPTHVQIRVVGENEEVTFDCDIGQTGLITPAKCTSRPTFLGAVELYKAVEELAGIYTGSFTYPDNKRDVDK